MASLPQQQQGGPTRDPPYNRYEAAAVQFIARRHKLQDETYTIDRAMKEAEFADMYCNDQVLQERVRRIVLKMLNEVPGNTSTKVVPPALLSVIPVSIIETHADSSPMSQLTDPSSQPETMSHFSYDTRLDFAAIPHRCHNSKPLDTTDNKENWQYRQSVPQPEKTRLHKLAMKTLVTGGKRGRRIKRMIPSFKNAC